MIVLAPEDTNERKNTNMLVIGPDDSFPNQ
jgi:hypothetical protein